MTIEPSKSSNITTYTNSTTGYFGKHNQFIGFQPDASNFGTGLSPIYLEYGVDLIVGEYSFIWNNDILTVTSNSTTANLQESTISCNCYVLPISKAIVLVGLDGTQSPNRFIARYRFNILGGTPADILSILFGYLEIKDPNGAGGRDERFRGLTSVTLAEIQYRTEFIGTNTAGGLGLRDFTFNALHFHPMIPTRTTINDNDYSLRGALNGVVNGLGSFSFSGSVSLGTDPRQQIYCHHHNIIGLTQEYNIYANPVNGGNNWICMFCLKNITFQGYTGDLNYASFPNKNELNMAHILGNSRLNNGIYGADTVGTINFVSSFDLYRQSGRKDITTYAFTCYRFKCRPNNVWIGFQQSEVNLLPEMFLAYNDGEGTGNASLGGEGYNSNSGNTHMYKSIAEAQVKYRGGSFQKGCSMDSYNTTTKTGQMSFDPALITDISKMIWNVLNILTGGSGQGSLQSLNAISASTASIVFASRLPANSHAAQYTEGSKFITAFQQVDLDGIPQPY